MSQTFKIRLILLSSMVLLSATLVTPPVWGQSAATELEWKVVPSERCRGLWIVPLRFKDKPDRVLRMILDTGASNTTIDPDAVQRVSGKKIKAGKKVRFRDLEAGPLQIHSIRMRTHQFDHLVRALGTDFDGILGFPEFEKILLQLDYPAGEIRVAKGSLPAIDDVTIFRDIGQLRPYLSMRIKGQPTPILLDSGSTGGLTLRESDPVSWSVEPRPLTASTRFNSIRLEKVGRSGETYQLGPRSVESPVVDLMKDGTRLAGFKILRGASWTFDTRNRRVRILPSDKTPITSDPFRGTGFALSPRERGFEVIKVFPDTSAAESGIEAGDLITAAQGTPIFERGCRTLDQMDEEGVLRLTIERDGQTRELPVALSVLVP